jgi:hypothetical protein
MSPTTTDSNSRRARQQRRPTHDRPVVSAGTARDRRASNPQDQALYRCGCGAAFTAEVSTSVGCPQCGTAQAW